MPPLNDPEILARYKQALSQWAVTGYVTWKNVPRQWVRVHLEDFNLRSLAQLMYQHVESGGEIDQVPERREEFSYYGFHYDLRLRIEGRLIYIETILDEAVPDDPVIQVVSIHEA